VQHISRGVLFSFAPVESGRRSDADAHDDGKAPHLCWNSGCCIFFNTFRIGITTLHKFVRRDPRLTVWHCSYDSGTHYMSIAVIWMSNPRCCGQTLSLFVGHRHTNGGRKGEIPFAILFRRAEKTPRFVFVQLWTWWRSTRPSKTIRSCFNSVRENRFGTRLARYFASFL
jgi:hypothetical protein